MTTFKSADNSLATWHIHVFKQEGEPVLYTVYYVIHL